MRCHAVGSRPFNSHTARCFMADAASNPPGALLAIDPGTAETGLQPGLRDVF